jgi:hypothetical protein
MIDKEQPKVYLELLKPKIYHGNDTVFYQGRGEVTSQNRCITTMGDEPKPAFQADSFSP